MKLLMMTMRLLTMRRRIRHFVAIPVRKILLLRSFFVMGLWSRVPCDEKTFVTRFLTLQSCVSVIGVETPNYAVT